MYISYICFLVFVVLTIYRTIPKLLLCEQCFFFNLCRDLHFTEFISFCFYIALSTLYRQSCILWLILGFYASIFGTARGVVDVLSGYFLTYYIWPGSPSSTHLVGCRFQKYRGTNFRRGNGGLGSP